MWIRNQSGHHELEEGTREAEEVGTWRHMGIIVQ